MLFIVTPLSSGVGTALLGIISGFAIVLTIRLGALLYFRNAFFTNFFRTNVVGANFFFLVSWIAGGCSLDLYLSLLTPHIPVYRSWKHGMWLWQLDLSLSASSSLFWLAYSLLPGLIHRKTLCLV